MKKSLIIKIVFALLFLFAFVFTLIMVVQNKTQTFDNAIYNFFSSNNSFLTQLFKIFTYLGWFFVLLAICVFVFVFAKNKQLKFGTPIMFAIACMLSTSIKYVVRRDRPINIALIKEIGFSFPSAHACLPLALYGFLMLYFAKIVKSIYAKILIIISTSLLILLLGISRIYLGVHFATDVIAGWLLGGFAISIYVVLCEIKSFKQNK